MVDSPSPEFISRHATADNPWRSQRNRMLETTLFCQDRRPEVYRVGLTNEELAANTDWNDLRTLLMHKGIPVYKLVEGSNFRQIEVSDGVILEFE